MCTKTIVESTTESIKGRGPISAVTHGIGGLTTGIGKELKGPFEQPDPTPLKPPKDLSGEEKRRRFRELQRTAAGRPGAGRAQTIFTGQTGAGVAGLKTKTGQ